MVQSLFIRRKLVGPSSKIMSHGQIAIFHFEETPSHGIYLRIVRRKNAFASFYSRSGAIRRGRKKRIGTEVPVPRPITTILT